MQPVTILLEKLAGISASTNAMHIPGGERLFASGDACENFVVVTKGQVRIQLSTKNGRDIVLFRLKPGQSCALTTSCLLSDSPYYAEGIAETDVDIVSIPAALFNQALAGSNDLMRILLQDYASRIGELTALADRLTSRDLNAELTRLLRRSRDRDGVVHLSHQAIAEELGSAREVISRKLKALEKTGLIELGRGRIIVSKPDALP